jgi:hypothetical protein
MYLESITKEIKYRSPEYFIAPITGDHYKMGLYEFKPFAFRQGFAFVWIFSKHNGESIYKGNSLHSTSTFKTMKDLISWIDNPKNLLELDI